MALMGTWAALFVNSLPSQSLMSTLVVEALAAWDISKSSFYIICCQLVPIFGFDLKVLLGHMYKWGFITLLRVVTCEWQFVIQMWYRQGQQP